MSCLEHKAVKVRSRLRDTYERHMFPARGDKLRKTIEAQSRKMKLLIWRLRGLSHPLGCPRPASLSLALVETSWMCLGLRFSCLSIAGRKAPGA